MHNHLHISWQPLGKLCLPHVSSPVQIVANRSLGLCDYCLRDSGNFLRIKGRSDIECKTVLPLSESSIPQMRSQTPHLFVEITRVVTSETSATETCIPQYKKSCFLSSFCGIVSFSGKRQCTCTQREIYL